MEDIQRADAGQQTEIECGIIRMCYSSKVVRLYKPEKIKGIFSATKECAGMVGTNNFDLAEAFYCARKQSEEADNYVRNAGAVQLFSKDGIEPVIKAYGAMSQSIKEQGAPQSSLGHSERILMRQVLDGFIIKNGHEDEIYCPSRLTRFNDGRQGTELDVYSQLVSRASEYKIYLIASKTIVKMWSELKACNYLPAKGEGEGGKCSDFIDSIFPQQSQFGYIAKIPKYTNGEKQKQIKKEAFGVFKEAYDGYIQYNEVVAEFRDMSITDDSATVLGDTTDY